MLVMGIFNERCGLAGQTGVGVQIVLCPSPGRRHAQLLINLAFAVLQQANSFRYFLSSDSKSQGTLRCVPSSGYYSKTNTTMGNQPSRLYQKLWHCLPDPDHSSSWFDKNSKPFQNHTDKDQFVRKSIFLPQTVDED